MTARFLSAIPMPAALVSTQFIARFGAELQALAERCGKPLSFITLPEQNGARLSQADCERIDCIFLDREIRFNEQANAAYRAALPAASNVKWVHYANSGIGQQYLVAELQARGVVLTSSTGSNAEPVAQTGMTDLLMMARGFPTYIQGQHRHEWRPLRGAALPDDLRDSVTQELRRTYGASLEATFAVNPALVGGMRIRVGSDVYDGSVRARLARLEARL